MSITFVWLAAGFIEKSIISHCLYNRVCSAVPATRSVLAYFADPSVFACLHMPTSQAGLHAFRVPVHDHASSLDAASPLVPLHCQA